MKNQKCESILHKSVHGVFAYISAVVFTVMAASIITLIFIQNTYLTAVHVIAICILALNTIILWLLPLSRKTSTVTFSALFKISLAIITGVATIILVLLSVSMIMYGDLQSVTSNLGELGQFLELFTVEGIIGMAVAFFFIFVYECLVSAFILALGNVYRGKTSFISGRFVSVFSFVLTGIGIMLIPVRVFFDEIAELMRIDTNVISLGNIHFHFEQYTLEDGFNLALLILMPLFYFLIAVITKIYADNKANLKDALTNTFEDNGVQNNVYETNMLNPSPSISQPYVEPSCAPVVYETDQQFYRSEGLVEEHIETSNESNRQDFFESVASQNTYATDGIDQSLEENMVDAVIPQADLELEILSANEADTGVGEEDSVMLESKIESEAESTDLPIVETNLPTAVPIAETITITSTADSISEVTYNSTPEQTTSSDPKQPAYIGASQPNAQSHDTLSKQHNVKNKPKLIAGTLLYDFGYSENSII